MKRAHKVSLISVHDYPRADYDAYWLIDKPEGNDVDGWRWGATIFSYTPVAWEWQGEKTTERPDFPMPVYPPDLPRVGPEAMPEHIAADIKAQEERRRLCAQIYEAHPKPLYELAHTVGVAKTKDEADTLAQQWVLERMGQYRRGNAPQLSDDDVRVLVAEFDRARRQRDYGNVDRIRGRLKSAGVTLEEGESISYPGYTTARRKEGGHAIVLGPADMLWQSAREFIEWCLRPLLMALAYSTTVRNNRMNQVRDAIDGGAGAGLWRIYDGSRPATCGTATTLLAELTCSDPCAAAASGGVLTFSSITADSSANATGTATWFRIVDSTGTCCVDGSVGTSGSDLNMNSTSISTGQQVSITSATITEGNA